VDISSIAETASLASRAGPENKGPEQTGRMFETMLFELLLKESGLSNSLGNGAGKEWAVLGDHFIQMLASQLAQEVDLGTGRLLAATTD
jgi:hypothetical protein